MKRPTAHPSKRGIFTRVGCNSVSYEFEPSPDAFDLPAFYRTVKMPESHRRDWFSTCASESPSSDYHIHFKGRVVPRKRGGICLTVEYIRGHMAPGPGERAPFAESFMPWLGKFFSGKNAHSSIYAMFEKSNKQWRSRFTLPWKVPMSESGHEVTIDGISLRLPKHKSGAKHGWITQYENGLWVAISLERRIEFESFDLGREMELISSGAAIFSEKVGNDES